MTALVIFLSLLVLVLLAALFYERKKWLVANRESDFSGTHIGQGKFSELGLMSAGIAHEISNPLAVIVAGVSRMESIYRRPGSEKEMARLIRQLGRSGERIARTVQRIRNYVYRDDNDFDDQIALSDILDDVLVFCGQRLTNHGIELRKIGIEGIYLRGYKGQLEQLILNLLNNSFDAVAGLPEKWIEIRAVVEADSIDIYFKDSGYGIAVDLRDQIMRPFFSTKKQSGSGFGLPLAKSICEKHGGSFEYIANSENTTFLIELPRAA